MADEKELQMEEGGKKKKMMIIIIATVVLLIGGGAAYFFLGSSDEVSDSDMQSAIGGGANGELPGEAVDQGTALYVKMPRPFVFNVPGASRDRLVQIKVQLLVRGAESEETAKKHIPLIEGTLLQVFSQANADDLATTAGKKSLKQKSLVEVQKTMSDLTSEKIIEKVLFTGFVMQ